MDYGVEDESHVDYATLNKLRLDGKFCDVVIQVQGFTMKAHKIVLCACSPYFRALFTGNLNSSHKSTYNIPGVLPEMMKIIIEYAYTHSAVITEGNLEFLLPAADQLCVLGLVQACADFLEAQLCTDNCIGIWRFADIYFCTDLQHRALRFILQNFQEVGRTSAELLELTPAELSDIVEKDDLVVKQEDRVFDAVLRWTGHMPTKRKAYLPQLLRKVRLAQMNPDYFMSSMKTSVLVKDNEDCKRITIHTLRAMCRLQKTNFVGTSGYSSLCRPRLPCAVLLAIGGWSGNRPTDVIESYDTQAKCWVTVAQMEGPRAYHGTACLGGFVYCLGGYDAVEFFSAVCKLDPVTRTWHRVAPMHSRRCYVSVAVLQGRIYAMGGFDGYARLSSAERYEPAANQWSPISSMHEPRSDASAATLDGKVYICGGFNGESCLCTAECYSPSTDQWTLIPPMKKRHSGLGVVAYNQQIYAVGGFDGVSRLRCMEVYDPLADSWRQMPDMIIARSNFGIEVLDDRLFVVGGFNGFSTTFYAEYFDQKTNEWGSIQDMGVFRSALSCCTVHDLPNVAEYAFPRRSGSPTTELSAFKELTLW